MDVEKKNVLYISYDGMTDALGQSQVLPYLIGLSKSYNVTLISFEKENNFIHNKLRIENLCIDNNIDWHPLKYTKNPPVLSTVFDVYKMRLKAIQLHKIKQFSLVHCRSYIPGMIGMYLKRKTNMKFLFDMRGFWPDERIDGNQWNMKNPFFKFIYSYFKGIEKKLFSNCDHCVSLTEVGRNEILSWNLKRTDKLDITVIPCCVDLELFNLNVQNDNLKQDLVSKYNINQNDLIICYLGSLSTVYMFNEVLELYSKIFEKYKNSKFLVFTHEIDAAKNQIEYYSTDLKSSIIIDKLDRTSIPTALSFCDYSIFFCKPTYARLGTSPTRLAELIACGVKVISNYNIGDSESHILDYNLGYVFKSFDEKSYSDFIENFSLVKNYDKTSLYNTSKELFDLEIGVKRYLGIYKKLTLS